MNCCNNEHKTEDNLISSLRKLVGRSEIYGSRPSLTIDVCSERQVQLMSEKEIQDLEEEQGRLVSGFREVIDLISTSQRLVVVHNSLNDFAFIHSKFLAPLPPTMNEFTSSLLSVYPHILDINHLMKAINSECNGVYYNLTSQNCEKKLVIKVDEVDVAGRWDLCTDRISFHHDAGSMIKYHKNIT